MECRLRGCEHEAEVADRGLCSEHLSLLAYEPRWCPVKLVTHDDGGSSTACGLCGKTVWPLVRLDDELHQTWTIEASSHPEGRVEIIAGGFRVANDKRREQLVAEGIPLYRAHPPVCALRAALIERVEATA